MKSLQKVIDVSIFVALERGQSPTEWLEAQRSDRDEFVLEFCQLVAQGVAERKKTGISHSGCILEMRIGTRAA